GAIYLLYMVGKVVWGPLKVPATHHDHGDDADHAAADAHDAAHAHPAVADLNLREIVTLLPLAVGCLWLGFFPTPIPDSLKPPLANIEAAATHDNGKVRGVRYELHLPDAPQATTGTRDGSKTGESLTRGSTPRAVSELSE